MRASWRMRMVVGLAVLAAGSSARAQEAEPIPGRFQFFKRYQLNKEGKPPKGRPRVIPNTFDRAGDPRVLAPYTAPSNTANGIGYYVGGSVPIGHRRGYADGARRRPDEGTWGWDETGGRNFRRRSILGWSHGRRYQGGVGSYATDGPVVPDLVYATTDTLQKVVRRERPEGEGEGEE